MDGLYMTNVFLSSDLEQKVGVLYLKGVITETKALKETTQKKNTTFSHFDVSRDLHNTNQGLKT